MQHGYSNAESTCDSTGKNDVTWVVVKRYRLAGINILRAMYSTYTANRIQICLMPELNRYRHGSTGLFEGFKIVRRICNIKTGMTFLS